MKSKFWLILGVLASITVLLCSCGAEEKSSQQHLGATRSPLASGVIAQINGEGGTIVHTPGVPTSTTGKYSESGKTYDIVEQGVNGHHCPDLRDRHRPIPQLRHHDCYLNTGNRCLVFQGYESNYCNGDDTVKGLDQNELDALNLNPALEVDYIAGLNQGELNELNLGLNLDIGNDGDFGDAFGIPDRLEVVLSHGGDSEAPETMNFGEWRYLRFFIRVHPDTSGPDSRTIISQVYQHPWDDNEDESHPGPPLAIFLGQHPTDPTKSHLDFGYRNDTIGGFDGAQTFHTATITKGSWYVFHVKMKAEHNESGPRGAVLIWRNEGVYYDDFVTEDAVNYSSSNNDSSWKFHWGYTPTDEPGVNLGNAFSVRVGIYRPGQLGFFTIWMDNIKLTDTPQAMSGWN